MTRARRLSLEELQPYLLEVPDDPGVIDPVKVFGNDHPIEIEIGCGKGLFLLNSALAHPDVNFLGIELDRKYLLFAATRIAKRNLRNARLAGADARKFICERLADSCCRRVHIYFPDPWWKTKHRKRRLFTADFVKACERVLVSGGNLSVATDVEEYFEIILKLVTAETGLRLAKTHLNAREEGFSTILNERPCSREPRSTASCIRRRHSSYPGNSASAARVSSTSAAVL